MNIHRSFLFLLCFGLLTFGAFGQYIEPDSTLMGHKNSILLQANPLLRIAIQANGAPTTFGLTYKRTLKEFKRLVCGLNYEWMNLSPRNQTLQPAHLVASTDSSVTLLETNETFSRMNIRGGLEWSSYIDKSAMFYGVTAHLGQRHQHYEAYTHQYRQLPIDTTLINPTTFANKPESSTGIYDYDHYFLEFGFALQIGYRIQLKQRWEINLSMNPEFSVYLPTKNNWNLDSPEPLQFLPSNGFEMNLRLLLVDIGYRF
jgi:hypothetical protein